MAYALSVKHITGRTLKAAVQDYLSGLYWDEVANSWVSAVTADCKVALTEDSTHKGFYTGSAADLSAVKGGLYRILVYDAADANYLSTSVITVPAKTETLLEVVNGVQRALRMPISAGITDQLSLSIIQKINDVITTILPNNGVLEHTKISGSFTTKAERPFYRISPANINTVDAITSMTGPYGSDLAGPMSDDDFRDLAGEYDPANTTTTGSPSNFRNVSMDAGFPVVELFPQPDGYYTITYEAIKRMDKVTAAADYVFQPDIVRIAATMMMKMDMGRDAALEKGLLEEALSLSTTSNANLQLGDVEV